MDSVEQWFAWALVPVVGAIIAWLMFSAATTELQTLIEHYTFVTAQQEGNLREWTRKFLVMKTALRAANQGEAK